MVRRTKLKFNFGKIPLLKTYSFTFKQCCDEIISENFKFIHMFKCPWVPTSLKKAFITYLCINPRNTAVASIPKFLLDVTAKSWL